MVGPASLWSLRGYCVWVLGFGRGSFLEIKLESPVLCEGHYLPLPGSLLDFTLLQEPVMSMGTCQEEDTSLIPQDSMACHGGVAS